MKNDVEPWSGINPEINISEVGKYEKFIKIEKLQNKDQTITEYRYKGLRFISNDLKKEKITEPEKKQSLKRMVQAIKIHIEKELEKEIYNLREKLYKKHKIRKLEKKINSMPDSLEDS